MDKKIDDINFNDQSLLSISSLSKFINSYFSIGLVADNISCLNIYNSELSKQQKQDVLTTLKRGISFYNLEDLESYYTTLRKLITDNNIFSAVEQKYQKILNLQKGNPSPSFNYSDTSGQNISLESLKGKLVYIDVWATWCGPCKAQIPYLKELEEKYRTREIAFVSMSIDKPKDAPKWKKMIQDKELSGIQIMADNAWGSSFVNEYVIEGIPRFILLDRNGNIINANAPRPATFNKGSYILNDAIEELLLMNL
jgi:thiol-disulfide isomerase/thioredoxin